MRTITNLVGGESAASADGRTADVMNPSTATAFAQAPVSGAADVDAAMEAAAGAFPKWRDATPSQRQLAMLKFADAIEAHADELVALEAENTGKPLSLRPAKSCRRWWTRCASSPELPACSKGVPQANTWRA